MHFPSRASLHVAFRVGDRLSCRCGPRDAKRSDSDPDADRALDPGAESSDPHDRSRHSEDWERSGADDTTARQGAWDPGNARRWGRRDEARLRVGLTRHSEKQLEAR